jgi:hypothetical protein
VAGGGEVLDTLLGPEGSDPHAGDQPGWAPVSSGCGPARTSRMPMYVGVGWWWVPVVF